MAKFRADIFHSSGGKKAGILESLEGDNLTSLVEDTIKLVKSFPRGRPFPIEFLNTSGEEPRLINKALVQGDRFDANISGTLERDRAAITPVRRTTLRNRQQAIVFTADDILDKPLTKADFKRARRFRRSEFEGLTPRLIQEGRRENFRELIDTEDFEPGQSDM